MILVRLDYQVHISETQLRVLNSKHHVQRSVCCRFKANCPLMRPGLIEGVPSVGVLAW